MENKKSSLSTGEVSVILLNFSTALCLNLLMCRLVYNEKRLQTSFNFFILNMCLADILVSLNMIISVSLSLIYGDFLTGETGCIVTGFINILCFVASVMALAAVSLNRYFLIVHWQRYRRLFSIRNTVIIISLVWMFSVLIVIPPLIGWGRYSYHDGKSICFADWNSSKSYMIFMIAICFCGPIASTLFSLYRILHLKRKVNRTLKIGQKMKPGQIGETEGKKDGMISKPDVSQRPSTQQKDESPDVYHEAQLETPVKTSGTGCRKGSSKWISNFIRRTNTETEENLAVKLKTKSEKQRKHEQWITLSIVAIVVVFFIAWGPFVVVMFLQTIGKVKVPRWADFGALFFGCMNSTVNPIISLTMNGNFRSAVTAIYKKKFGNYKKYRTRTNTGQ